MKLSRLFLIVILLALTNDAYSHFELRQCVCYDGYWGNWKDMNDCRIRGNYDGFIIYEDNKHPSNFFFSFQINGFVVPSKKDIKKHYKNKIWWEYSGYVEYYICDLYPTVVDVFKEKGRLLREDDLSYSDYDRKLSTLKASKMAKGQSFNPIGFKKVRKNATIKIAPYKKVPQVYNIYFDGGGYAIDLNNLIFIDGKPKQVVDYGFMKRTYW